MTENSSQARPRLQVEAIYVPACKECGDSRVRNGKYVEGACPNCGTELQRVTDLGCIHDTWGELSRRFKGWFLPSKGK